jgi:GAF domain-containing protein
VLILQIRGGVLVTFVSVLLYLGLVVLQRLGVQPVPLPYDPQGEALLTVGSRVIMFFLLSFLAWLSNQGVNRALEHTRQTTLEAQDLARQLQEINQTLEERVVERTRGLQAAAEVSRVTTTILDPDELMRQTADLVRERFNLYYVGLFIVAEGGRFALLRAGTGEAGQLMLAQAHGLTVGGDSMIGRCISGDEAIIALDVGEQAVRFDNPLLPKTRSEMALPLRSRGHVIGAMTVQSAQEAAFDEADIAVMQNMADQVATAIDNARLYAQTQAALQEAEATQQRYLGQEWARYTTDRQVSGYEQAGDRVAPLRDSTLPEVQWALREQRPLAQSAEPSTDAGHLGADQLEEPSPSQLVVPIMLSGQPIGALGVKDPDGGRQWSEEDVALAEAVAEQLGLAAENLRLLDQTQRRAAREQLTRQITDSVRAAVDVEDAIQRAIQELGRVLGASEMIARIGTEPDLLSDSLVKNEERTQ